MSSEKDLKYIRNLLALNPDDPLGEFLTHTDLIDIIDKLLSLRTAAGLAREEIERLKERVSKIRKLDDISEEQFAEDVKGSFEENSKYIDGDIEDPSVFKIYDLGYRIGFGSAMGLSDFEEGYFSGVESLQSQIATLTSRAEAAEKEVERLMGEVRILDEDRERYVRLSSNKQQVIFDLRERITALTAERDEAREFREIVTLFCQGDVKGLRINYFNGFVVTRSDGVADQSWDGPDLLEVLREMKTSLTEQWEETI